jgi:hypothetical protein
MKERRRFGTPSSGLGGESWEVSRGVQGALMVVCWIDVAVWPES